MPGVLSQAEDQPIAVDFAAGEVAGVSQAKDSDVEAMAAQRADFNR